MATSTSRLLQRVYKQYSGFLPEVPDITTLPTVKPPGEPAFSRNVANNTVTVRLYVGDPLIAVLPAYVHVPSQVPILTPVSLLALVGLLSAIAAVAIVRKKQ